MANEKLDLNITIEGMKESFDALLSFCREMADREKEKEEPKETWKEQKDIVKNEFNRIGYMLERAKPGTPEYSSLINNLRELKNTMGYWD